MAAPAHSFAGKGDGNALPVLPTDIIIDIIQHADWPTLKALSLMSHNSLTASAPILCRSFIISVKAKSKGSNPRTLAAYTDGLKNHSRAAYIKCIYIDLYGKLRNMHGRPSVKVQFTELILAFKGLKRFELLEIDLSVPTPSALVEGLRNVELPITLSHLRLFCNIPNIATALGESFWKRHAPHLKSLVFAGAAEEGSLENNFPAPFPVLKDLSVAYPYAIQDLHIPGNTLRSLAIAEIRQSEVSELYETLANSPGSGAPIIANLENFEFDCTGTGFDPAYMYASVVTHMSQLRKVKAKHDRFSSERSLSDARDALLRLPYLEEFEWMTEDRLFIVKTWEPDWQDREILVIGDWGPMGMRRYIYENANGYGDDEGSRAEEEGCIKFAESLNGCESLRRVIFWNPHIDDTGVVVSRTAFGAPWNRSSGNS